MFTFFHVILLACLVGGVALGMAGGAQLFGVTGGIVGALAGGLAGLVIGRIPVILVLRSLAREFCAKTSSELRAHLRDPDCLAPNVVLLELQSRGEDIRQDLPVVLDWLISQDVGRREKGWAALTSAFPELVSQIPDYRIDDSVDECRRKTDKLRT
jgi:hypothetical protein